MKEPTVLQGLRNGPGLKSQLNSADTGSVVHTAEGYAKTGSMKVSGNDPKRNSMVSANATMKK